MERGLTRLLTWVGLIASVALFVAGLMSFNRTIDIVQVFGVVLSIVILRYLPTFRSIVTAGASRVHATVGAEPTAHADNDLAFWDSQPNKDDREWLKAYLRRYPNGRFVELARVKLEQLSPSPPPQVVVPQTDLLANSAIDRAAKDDLFANMKVQKEASPRASKAPLVLGVLAILVLIGGVTAFSLGMIRVGGTSQPLEPPEPSPDVVLAEPAPLADEPTSAPAPKATIADLIETRGAKFDAPLLVVLNEPTNVSFAIGPAPRDASEFGYLHAELSVGAFRMDSASANLPFDAQERRWHWGIVPTSLGELVHTVELRWWPPGTDPNVGDEPSERKDFLHRMIVVQRGEIPASGQGPYVPAEIITVRASDVRIRARPQANIDVPIVAVSQHGDALDVVGIVKQSDWVWYEVRMGDGSNAYVRSDLTSQPLRGTSSNP